jgi:hypothetical protein
MASSITKDDAKRIALEFIEGLTRQSGNELALLQTATLEKSFGWIFFYQSKSYLQSREPRDAVVGNAPIVVAKLDGRVHVTGTAHPIEYYIAQLATAEGWNAQE